MLKTLTLESVQSPGYERRQAIHVRTRKNARTNVTPVMTLQSKAEHLATAELHIGLHMHTNVESINERQQH